MSARSRRGSTLGARARGPRRSSRAPTSTTIVRDANAALGDHQKIRAAAVWPGAELPRTEGTRKLKRRELKAWLAGSAEATSGRRAPATRTRSVASVLARFAPGRTIAAATTIDELGLSSLERVELMMALEETFQVTVDESALQRRPDGRPISRR